MDAQAAWPTTYKRHGTTTLFAALNVLDGQVIGHCQATHTHVEWLRFLRKIDRVIPKGKDLHLIADNYATHKHPVVRAWLAIERVLHCVAFLGRVCVVKRTICRTFAAFSWGGRPPRGRSFFSVSIPPASNRRRQRATRCRVVSSCRA